MHRQHGYVVVAATPVLFKAAIGTIIVPKTIYQVTVTFDNKKIFFRSQRRKELQQPNHRRGCRGVGEQAGHRRQGTGTRNLPQTGTGTGAKHGDGWLSLYSTEESGTKVVCAEQGMQPFLLYCKGKIKSQGDKYVELKEVDYLLLLENTILIEALKIAGIEAMPIYKAMRRTSMTSGWKFTSNLSTIDIPERTFPKRMRPVCYADGPHVV